MKIYAERPGKVARQVMLDLVVTAWVYGWLRIAFGLHGLLGKLGGPGARLDEFGTSLADNLGEAGSSVRRLPIVGDQVATPLTGAADAARNIAEAGQQEQEFVHQIAIVIPVVFLVVPLSLVLFLWLPLRIRGIRRRTVMARLRHDREGQDLLALRALTRRSLRRLTAVYPDIATSWRRGDEHAVMALAALELGHAGLRAPATEELARQ